MTARAQASPCGLVANVAGIGLALVLSRRLSFIKDPKLAKVALILERHRESLWGVSALLDESINNTE
ncbi:MAG: hypothetical protein N838_16550 [Thiohalocapsa sp. PB-PSB1]|nr:MAG: hypothetical protein N838_30780 [Thiohalocapsa sp. PB-PSB1]QQO54707.1 MAG: hypothetical protein N838_16550 [Thiohalocapsa sp. PB-PSB1]